MDKEDSKNGLGRVIRQEEMQALGMVEHDEPDRGAEGHYRSADIDAVDPLAFPDGNAHSSLKGQSHMLQQEEKATMVVPTKVPEREIEHSTLKLNITHENKNDENIYKQLKEIIDGLPSADPIYHEQNRSVFGNYYKHGNHCEFMCQLFAAQKAKNRFLDFKRLTGDGFVLDTFFNVIRGELTSRKLLHPSDVRVPIKPVDLVSEDWYEDSEDEAYDSEEFELLKPGGFLQLKHDVELIDFWCTKLKEQKDLRDMNHVVGLMAHNSQDKQNLKIMMDTNADGIINCIDMIFADCKFNDAALVRNTSVLLRSILSSKIETKKQWNENTIKLLSKTIAKWAPRSKKDINVLETAEVDESRETVFNLSVCLELLSNRLKIPFINVQKILLKELSKDSNLKKDLITFTKTGKPDLKFLDTILNLIE